MPAKCSMLQNGDRWHHQIRNAVFTFKCQCIHIYCSDKQLMLVSNKRRLLQASFYMVRDFHEMDCLQSVDHISSLGSCCGLQSLQHRVNATLLRRGLCLVVKLQRSSSNSDHATAFDWNICDTSSGIIIVWVQTAFAGPAPVCFQPVWEYKGEVPDHYLQNIICGLPVPSLVSAFTGTVPARNCTT